MISLENIGMIREQGLSAVQANHSSVENGHMKTKTRSDRVNGLGTKDLRLGAEKRTEELEWQKWIEEKMHLKPAREVQVENGLTVNMNAVEHFAEALMHRKRVFEG